MAYRVALDVGGTFTDLVSLDAVSWQILNIKLPTTIPDPTRGVVACLKEFLTSTGPKEAMFRESSMLPQ